MSEKLKKRFGNLIYHIFVAFFAFLMVYPVLWMIFGSFKTSTQILNESHRLFPTELNWDNYIKGWKGFGVLRSLHSSKTPYLLRL